ncbi:MAG: bifunctional diguanylate cyclase/phosphodiesterase [Clostridiales bacterium]|nr:bifunctional diguanylate cyclase/phosphodiesterase [Clostridiales bacterium]
MLKVFSDFLSNNKVTGYIIIIAALVFLIAVASLIIESISSKLRVSYTDSITGRMSYTFLQSKVSKIINKKKQSKYTFIIFDVDQFKFFNDIHGYDEGNRVLKAIANITAKHLVKHEYCARISADNFVVIMKKESDKITRQRLFEIFEAVEKTFVSEDNSYNLIFDAGVYNMDEEDNTFNVMLDRAGIARSLIKGGCQSEIMFYDEQMRQKMVEEKEISETMYQALKDKEFIVYYQPKYSFAENKIVGAEALVRWKHPEKGLIPPFKFIPLFEKNGFVVNIDYYVFECVCKKMREWLDNGIEPVLVSINMSKLHFRNDNFIPTIQSIAEKYDIPSKYIELEITESTAFENVDVLLGVMSNLQKIGFMLSMDDFGAGYSSLGLLKDLPVDIIKLDCSFLRSSFETERTKIIVKKIVELAQELDIEVIAEGVETQEHADFLKEIGCDLAQGYYYAKPMPIEDFENYIGITKSETVEAI